jgi:hypothetical protein
LSRSRNDIMVIATQPLLVGDGVPRLRRYRPPTPFAQAYL